MGGRQGGRLWGDGREGDYFKSIFEVNSSIMVENALQIRDWKVCKIFGQDQV